MKRAKPTPSAVAAADQAVAAVVTEGAARGRTLPGGGGVRYMQAKGIRKCESRDMVCPDCGAVCADGTTTCPSCDCDMTNAKPLGDARTIYDVAVTSEFVVEREFYGMKWREVLDHSPGAIQLDRFRSGTAAVLEEHVPPNVGVIRTAWLGADRVLRAQIRFSRTQRGQDVQMDVDDEIRSCISGGYLPKRARLEEENAELGDLWRITLWEPVELSVVAVPADPTVGVGRGMAEGDGPPVEIEDGSAVEEEQMIRTRLLSPTGAGGGVSDPPVAVAPEVRSAPAAVAAAAVAANHADEQRSRQEIRDLCDANRGVVTRAQETEWIAEGLDIRSVAGKIVEMRRTKGAAQPGAESLEGVVPARDMAKFSVARAIMGQVNLLEGRKFDGLEAEVHEELERNVPQGFTRHGGVLVPMSLGRRAQRNLASNAATKGAEVTFEAAGDLIEFLRNRTALIQLGARVLTGLTQPISFPRQTAAMTGVWVGENPGSDISNSDIALGTAMLAMKMLQCSTAYSRQLLMQPNFDTESMVREEIGKVHVVAVDRAGIHGLGAAGEPTGIYKAANVSTTAVGGAMSYAKLLAMQGQVAALNADLGELGWLMNPTMATNLRGILDFPSSAGGRPIWTGTYQDGQVAGYKAIATNQVSAVMTGSEVTGGSEYGAIYGNFGDLIIGQFGALELIVDNVTLKKRGGMIEVTSYQGIDILVRHGESFSKATGATG